MPITKEDLEKITPEEMVLLKTELKLHEQSVVDNAFGKGKAEGIKEADGKSKEDIEKLQAQLKEKENEAAVSQAINDLGLDLSEEHKASLLALVGNDVTKVAEAAKLIKPQGAEFDPHKKVAGAAKENLAPTTDPSAKNEDGTYKDPIIQKMNEKYK